jgi:cholest-4-en-3-one 26-monooxygenase
MTTDTRPEVFSPDFLIDPYPQIEWLREEEPVHWVEDRSLWFVTRYEDIKRLMANAEIATPDRRAWEGYEAAPDGSYLRWLDDHSPFALERSEHLRVRRLVTAALTPRAVARMDGQIAEVVERFAAPLRGRSGVVDVMSEFTDPIPNTVISRITGIPPSGDDEVRFRRLAKPVITHALPFAPEGTQAQAEAALVELTAWVREMAEERRVAPQEDLITDLINTHDMGDQMTSDEIVMMVAGLIVAGSETTAMAGMVAIMTLLEHPEIFDAIKANRTLVPQAVLEIIRYGLGGPGALPRYAVTDFEIGGKNIRKGQMLMLSFGAANRDPNFFDRPNEFDLSRDQTNLITFGFGAHHCLGMHLAKAELGAIVDAICDFVPTDAQIRPELMEFEPLCTFPRPVTFPIDFGG